MKTVRSTLLALALATAPVAVPSIALAQAPEPRAHVDVDRFMGRWYEILRTPNTFQHNCWAASQVWSRTAPNRFSIAQNCHRGSRTGRLTTTNTNARVIDTTTNAKWEASFFGGIIKKRYWVIDIAPDYSWMIASTDDGQFPALLSRSATMSEAQQAELTARMGRLGLPTRQLEPSGR